MYTEAKNRHSQVAFWLKTMATQGVSEEPVRMVQGSFLEIGQQDPEDVKSERFALAAIISARVTQRAIKFLDQRSDYLSVPSVHTIDSRGMNPRQRQTYLKEKFRGIRDDLVKTYGLAMIQEERYIQTLPETHDLVRVYRRLENMVAPHIDKIHPNEHDLRMLMNERIDPSFLPPVSLYILKGVEPLYANIHNMLIDIPKILTRQNNRPPLASEVVEVVASSYHSYVNKLASAHRDSIDIAAAVDDITCFISDGKLQILPAMLKLLEDENKKATGSVRAMCALKASAELVKPFLDEPLPDQNALKFAYDSIVRILAA